MACTWLFLTIILFCYFIVLGLSLLFFQPCCLQIISAPLLVMTFLLLKIRILDCVFSLLHKCESFYLLVTFKAQRNVFQ